MFRTKNVGFGFPYPISGNQQERARQYSRDLWLNDKQPNEPYPSVLVDKFAPVPGWHDDTKDRNSTGYKCCPPTVIHNDPCRDDRHHAANARADESYARYGAEILADKRELFARADMVMKVKEPLPPEYELFREGHILFTYLHLAPEPELTKALLVKKVTGIAYETIEGPNHSLPLLTPMSEIAGRMAVQGGMTFLEKPQKGKGVLLGGIAGVHPGSVVIIGGGVVGDLAGFAAGYFYYFAHRDQMEWREPLFILLGIAGIERN
jgi:hypothetical protein